MTGPSSLPPPTPTPPSPAAPLEPTLLSGLTRWLKPGYLWWRLRQNALPKLLALLAACGLWYATTSDRRSNVQQGFDVPVTVRDTTGGNSRRAVSALTPETVRVMLSGRPERLRELKAANIEVLVDVTGLPEGSFNRPVTVTPPANTSLVSRSPERVQGFVDAQLTRTLPVTLSVANPPEDSLPRYAISPAQVSVSGPSRVVRLVSQVTLVPVSLAVGEEREVPLLALDALSKPVEDVKLRPSSVTLTRVDSGNVPLKALPVVLAPVPAGSKLRVQAVSVQPSSVRVVADPALLSRLREVMGQADYHVGTYTAPVTLHLPDGVQALDSVNVRLTVEQLP